MTNVLYINLDSRTDRRLKMEEQLKLHDLSWTRIKAVDKDEARKQLLHLDVRSKNNLKSRSKTSHLDIDGWGAVGCSLSHLTCWKYILEQGWESCWILEDDAIILKKEDVQVSENRPFVWLGLRGEFKLSPSYPYSLLDYDRIPFGAHSYCVHKSVLPLLISNFELSIQVDYLINEILSYHEVPTGYLALCTTNEEHSYSDITHFAIRNTSITGAQNMFFLLLAAIIIVFVALAWNS